MRSGLRTLPESPTGVNEFGDGVLDRDEVASVLAMRLFDIGAALIECGRESDAKVGEFGLETNDLLDTLEVDALVGQLLDSSKCCEVRIREAP